MPGEAVGSPIATKPGRLDVFAACVAAGMAVAVFWPALQPGQTLSGNDLVLWVPEFVRTFRDGLYFPRWMPYYYAGIAQQFQFLSHAGFTMVAVPPATFHAVQFTLDVFIAGFGMWCLCRSWNLKPIACFVGMFAFPLSNHLLTWAQAGHLWKYDTTCWTPWLLLALDRAHSTGRWRWFVWTGLFFGLHLLGGDVQLAYYVGLVVAAFTVARFANRWVRHRSEGTLSVGGGLVRQCVGHVVAIAIALGFGAEVIWQYAHLLQTQDIVVADEAEGAWKFATQFSLPPEETVSLVLGGGIFGNSLDGPHYWGREIARGTDDYLGIIVVLFAITSIVVRRDRLALWWSVVALASLAISYGKYLPTLYEGVFALPFMGLLRNPNRWLFVTSWATATLCALGADAWFRSLTSAEMVGRRRMLLAGSWFSFVILAGVSLLVSVRGAEEIASLLPPLGRGVESAEIALRSAQLLGELWRSVALLGLWCVLITVMARSSTQPASGIVATAGGVLAGALALDLIVHVRPFIRTYDAREAYAETALLQSIQETAGAGRVKVWAVNPELRDLIMYQFPYFGIATIDVIASRRPPAYTELFRAWRSNQLATERMFAMFSVRSLISSGPLPVSAPTSQTIGVFDDVVVARLKHAAPRASLVSDFTVVPATDILQHVIADDSASQETVLFTETPVIGADGLGAPVSGAVQLREERPDLLAFDVTTEHPAILVVQDLYDRYWRAYVDGEERHVLQANGLFRAVLLPASTNARVELRYEPPRWPWLLTIGGWWVFAVLLLGQLASFRPTKAAA